MVVSWNIFILVLYQFLVAEDFEWLLYSFFNEGVNHHEKLWTFEFDSEVVADAKIVIDLPFIVHVAWEIT